MKMQSKSVIPYSHPIRGSSLLLEDEGVLRPCDIATSRKGDCYVRSFTDDGYFHQLPRNSWLEDRIGHLGWRCVNIPSRLQFEYYGLPEKLDWNVRLVTPDDLLPMLRIAEFTKTQSKRIIVIRDGGGSAIAICYYTPSFLTSSFQYQAVWLATCNILGRENIVLSRYFCATARLLTWYE